MLEIRERELIISGLYMLSNGILSYYCFARGEMDIARIGVILFFASVAAFAYSAYEFSQKKAVGVIWNWVLGLLALILLLSGAASRSVITIVFGTFLLFATASSYLTSYVRSDHIVKRALEAVFMLLALGVIIYGYVMTGSFILGVITLFILAMFFFAFVVSYFLPRIRSKPKNCGDDVKNEEKEKGDFAYNVGRELGREMRKGLEENWKSHVIAGVIAAGCGLFSILLKLPWWFIITVVFISYHAAYSALFILFENKGERAKK